MHFFLGALGLNLPQLKHLPSVTLGNYLQQTTSAEDIFRCIFFLGTLRVKLTTIKTSTVSKVRQLFAAEDIFRCIFFLGPLRVKLTTIKTSTVSNGRHLFAADDFSRRYFQMHFFSWRFKC